MSNRIITSILLLSSLMFGSIPQLRSETNDLSQTLPLDNQEIVASPLPATPELDKSLLEKLYIRQLKGLFFIKSYMMDYLSLYNNALERSATPLAQWIDQELTNSNQVAQFSIDDLSARLIVHSAIVDYFNNLLITESNTAPFNVTDTIAHITEKINEFKSDLPKIVDATNAALNSLITISSQKYQELVGTVITQQRAQLSRLQEILQLIMLKINQSTSPHKSSYKEQVMTLRNQIQFAYQSINQQGMSLQLIKELHTFIKTVTGHLEATKNNIAKITPLDEDSLTRSGKLDVDVALMQHEAAAIDKRLAIIEEQAELSDLTWIERSARNISEYVLSPLYRHRNAIGFGIGLLGLSGAIWYYFNLPGLEWLRNKELWGQKIIGWYKTKEARLSEAKDIDHAQEYANKTVAALSNDGVSAISSPPSIHLDSPENQLLIASSNASSVPSDSSKSDALSYAKLTAHTLNTPKPEGILSKADHFLFDFTSGAIPIMIACGYFTYNNATKAWKQYRISDRVQNFINYLKGGVYKYQTLKKEHALAPVTFDEVIGMEHAKELMLQVFNFLENPERWILAGINIPTVFLFTGETRSGKTHMANAVRGEGNKRLSGKINFQFREVTHEEVSTVGIKEILEIAKLYWAPCILFIDELHLLQLQDVGNSKVYTDFLTALSGLDAPDPKKPVILIAATNNRKTWALHCAKKVDSVWKFVLNIQALMNANCILP